MKVNLDYYRPNNELNKLTSEEIFILDKFFKDTYESIDSYDKLLTLESSFSEIKALSDNRKNIVEFYPIGKEETVLEIGAGFGTIACGPYKGKGFAIKGGSIGTKDILIKMMGMWEGYSQQ
jgi:hypothetical protein